jgi:hypothetical protein
MKRYTLISKISQIVLIVLFLLPFFKGCQYGGPSAKELKERAEADSIAIADSLAQVAAFNAQALPEDGAPLNLIQPDSAIDDTSTVGKEQSTRAVQWEDTTENFFNRVNADTIKFKRLDYKGRRHYTDQICIRYPWLSPLLTPYEGHSGYGYMIDYWYSFVYMFGIYVSVLLSLFVLIFKWMDYSRYRIANILLGLVGWVLLYNTYGTAFHYGRFLWGYWLCLLFWVLLLLFDIWLAWVGKKSN